MDDAILWAVERGWQLSRTAHWARPPSEGMSPVAELLIGPSSSKNRIANEMRWPLG